MYSAFYRQILAHLNLCKKLGSCKYYCCPKTKHFTLAAFSLLREKFITYIAISYIVLLILSFCLEKITSGSHFIKLVFVFGILAYRVALFNASFALYSASVHEELANFLNRVFSFEKQLKSLCNTGTTLLKFIFAVKLSTACGDTFL